MRGKNLLKIGDETIGVIDTASTNITATSEHFFLTLSTLMHLLQQREVLTSYSDIDRRYQTTDLPEMKVHWELRSGLKPIKVVGKRKKELVRMMFIGCYLSRGKGGIYQKEEAAFEIGVLKGQRCKRYESASICRIIGDLPIFIGHVLTDFPEIRKTVLWSDIKHASKVSCNNQ